MDINSNDLQYAIDTVKKIGEKNTDKRIAKNLDFLFGENYTNSKEFRSVVRDLFFTKENKGGLVSSSPINDRFQILHDKLKSFDIGNSKESFIAFDNMMNFTYTKLYSPSKGHQIFPEVVKKAKEQGLSEKDIRQLFETNMEVANSLGLDSDRWNLNENIYNKYLPTTDPNYKNYQRKKRQKARTERIQNDYLSQYQQEYEQLIDKRSQLRKSGIRDTSDFDEQISRLQEKINSIKYERQGLITTLGLNPPREGAPMFEGNIVPSEIADTDTYEKILNTKAEQIRNEINVPNNSVDIQDSKNYRKLKKGEGTYRRKSKGTQTVEPKISDLDDDTLANLTDEEILEWAQNSDDYNEVIELRKKAREKLGMDAAPEIETTGKNTELETPLNNNLNNRTSNTNTNTIDNAEETIEEKIKRLTEEERQRFERESRADFDKSMEEIEAEFNQEAERIENEFGPAKYDLDNTSLHLDAPNVKTRKQRLENAGKRLSNNKGPNGTKKRFTGQRVANNSKRSIKKRKLSGKKFKVKGGNLKQAAANTFVNIATETVRETISKNADELKNFGRHPNMFEFDEFADLTDADIDFYYDNLFGMDVKTKQQMKKTWMEKRKLAKTARESAKKRKIVENFDDYVDNFFSYTGYSSVEGQARFNPDPEIGWDETDFKNPDSYNRRRMDFEVDDDGNLKIKKHDEMETIEIEQNKSRRVKSNIDDDDIFGWMKKHKIGLGEAINVLSTISSYKDARKQGHSVGSSVVRAAGSFVMGEMLGFWGSMGWELAKGIPKAAIKGAEVLYKENRKMNAAANQHGLGGDFQDTQQLATMRQSGMEMAKMAQYNLQQTLMGNEASFLHR